MEERTIRTERPFRGRGISLRVDEVELASGRRTTREVVEHPGAVAIVAWDGSRVAMVRQWRHATGATLLEIPAGTREEGEEPEATARRELGEEVGRAGATWRRGPVFYTAPGFCTELMHLFLATDLTDTSAAADDDEELEPAWLTVDEALAAIDDGRVRDAKTIIGLWWLERLLASGLPSRQG
jgi:ADP-ribose pyrophosphatase